MSMSIRQVRDILYNPRRAAEKRSFANGALTIRLLPACIFLHAPSFLRPFNFPLSSFVSYNMMDYMYTLIYQAGFAGCIFAVFRWIAPAILKWLISRASSPLSKKDKQNLRDAAAFWSEVRVIALFILLIYLLISFPFSFMSLLADLSGPIYTYGRIGLTAIAAAVIAIWLYKALFPYYIESRAKAVRTVLGCLLLTVLSVFLTIISAVLISGIFVYVIYISFGGLPQ
jgi:hypothetical protein